MLQETCNLPILNIQISDNNIITIDTIRIIIMSSHSSIIIISIVIITITIVIIMRIINYFILI